MEKSFGPDDLRLVVLVKQLAELKTEDGDYDDAERLYRRALRIDESKVGSIDRALIGVLTGYADLLQKMNRSEEAKTLADQAKSLAGTRTPKNLTLATAASVPRVAMFT